jgi:predicted  nucleic acid-binding Zn-ribbon protein
MEKALAKSRTQLHTLQQSHRRLCRSLSDHEAKIEHLDQAIDRILHKKNEGAARILLCKRRIYIENKNRLGRRANALQKLTDKLENKIEERGLVLERLRLEAAAFSQEVCIEAENAAYGLGSTTLSDTAGRLTDDEMQISDYFRSTKMEDRDD